MVIAKVIKAKGETSDDIKVGLYAIKDYDGVSGKISFDKNGDTSQPPRFYAYKDRKIEDYTPLP